MQIARCFRDEDLRADRQPEFTQLDLEMAWMDRDAIMSLMENMVAAVFKQVGFGADGGWASAVPVKGTAARSEEVRDCCRICVRICMLLTDGRSPLLPPPLPA